MAHRELIGVNESGVAEYAHFNSDGDLEAIHLTDDVESVLEANLQNRLDGSGGYGQSREWQHKYRIPISLLGEWEAERGLPQGFLMTREGFDLMLKIAADPDYGKLRTDK